MKTVEREQREPVKVIGPVGRPVRIKDAVRQSFSEALMETLPQLIEDAHSPDAKVRQAARETLARYGPGTSQDVNMVGNAEVVEKLALVFLRHEDRIPSDLAEQIVLELGTELSLRGA